MKSRTLFFFLGCSLSLGNLAWATPPGKKVIAGPESTVYGIAYEHGISTRALISANNLKAPYVLQMGQELIIPSPNEHVVGEGETLKSIADNYGVDVDVLAQENDIHAFRQGEALSIPSRDTQSVNQALKTSENSVTTSSLDPLPSVKSTSRPIEDTVSGPNRTGLPSDVAEEIAREKGIKIAKVPEVSKSSKPSLIEHDSGRGAKPSLMGNLAQRNAGAPTAATTTVRLEEEDLIEKPKPLEKKVKQVKMEKIKEKDLPKKPSPDSEVAQASQNEAQQSQFNKPVEFSKEDILSKFKAGANDGIRIKVPEGTAVKAAAAGDVLYAGDKFANERYGNLVVLKHEGGWVTAYANNSILLVKKGDSIRKGQVIAKSGKTGDAKEPLLHFEVRKGKQAVDPLSKLES